MSPFVSPGTTTRLYSPERNAVAFERLDQGKSYHRTILDFILEPCYM